MEVALGKEMVALCHFLQGKFGTVGHVFHDTTDPFAPEPFGSRAAVVCLESLPEMGIAHAAHACHVFSREGMPFVHFHFQHEYGLFQFLHPAFRILHLKFFQRCGNMAERVTPCPEEIVAYPVCHAVQIGASPHAAKQVAEKHQFCRPVSRLIDGNKVVAQVAIGKIFR